jgi:hypothetical protein
MSPDYLLAEPYNAVHSCSRHGVAAVRLNSERPGSVITVSKTFTLLGGTIKVLEATIKVTVTVDVFETDGQSSLYTAAVGTAWQLLGSTRNGQAAL